MSKSVSFRFLTLFLLVCLVGMLGASLYADTTAPAVTDGTAPISSAIGTDNGPITSTAPADTTVPGTSAVPDSSTMLDPDLTTTPDTVDTMPDKDNTLDGDKNPDDGFNYTGLIIAIIIAVAVILLVILLVPKNKNRK